MSVCENEPFFGGQFVNMNPFAKSVCKSELLCLSVYTNELAWNVQFLLVSVNKKELFCWSGHSVYKGAVVVVVGHAGTVISAFVPSTLTQMVMNYGL